MDIFDQQCDFLREVMNCPDSIADDCIMEWPFFSWTGRNGIHKALQQSKDLCSTMHMIFNGANRDTGKSTFLYKLSQDKRPNLWCGIWVEGNDKIKNIKFIFDSFESFMDGNTVEIFGFRKVLETVIHGNTIQENLDKNIPKIIHLIQNFFLKKYGVPIQDTPTAKCRLYQAAIEANTILKSSNEYTVILPFFSATEKGPIQFYATISKINESSYKIV